MQQPFSQMAATSDRFEDYLSLSLTLTHIVVPEDPSFPFLNLLSDLFLDVGEEGRSSTVTTEAILREKYR